MIIVIKTEVEKLNDNVASSQKSDKFRKSFHQYKFRSAGLNAIFQPSVISWKSEFEIRAPKE